MAGVWHFSQGVARLDDSNVQTGRLKALVYLPTNQTIASYPELEAKLVSIGWSRLYPSAQLGTIQFHKCHSSNHLITLPMDFRSLKPMHLLDIAMKNREYFEVRDK